jgi:hypothetical protein
MPFDLNYSSSSDESDLEDAAAVRGVIDGIDKPTPTPPAAPTVPMEADDGGIGEGGADGVDSLQEMFPEMDKSTLEAILGMCNDDLDAAVDCVLNSDAASASAVAAPAASASASASAPASTSNAAASTSAIHASTSSAAAPAVPRGPPAAMTRHQRKRAREESILSPRRAEREAAARREEAMADAARAWQLSGQSRSGASRMDVATGKEETVSDPLVDLLFVLRDPLCVFEGKEVLVQLLLGETPGVDDVSGCVWHEKISAKSSRQALSSEFGLRQLDAQLFVKLLEKGTAFAIPQVNAQKHWHLGPIEKELMSPSHLGARADAGASAASTTPSATTSRLSTRASIHPFKRLYDLHLPESVRERNQAGAAAKKLPDQGKSHKHTIDTWLDVRADKLLHWPIKKSPRIERLLQLPRWLEEANLLNDPSLRCGATFETKLQLVHGHEFTPFHRDNGLTDTWMKILVGKVLVACWSMSDGEAFDLHDQPREDLSGREFYWREESGVPHSLIPPDWAKFRRMPSARLFLLTEGDVLTMPCGTFHYVYTVQRKIVVAGDFCDDSCFERRRANVERDTVCGIGVTQQDKTTGDLERVLLARRGEIQRCASRASCSSSTPCDYVDHTKPGS